MKFRLPCALLFLLSATLAPAIHSEQVTVSTGDELKDALDSGSVDINLTEGRFYGSFTLRPTSENPAFTFKGVRDGDDNKTIFRGWSSDTEFDQAFYFTGKGQITMENCSFESYRSNFQSSGTETLDRTGGAIYVVSPGTTLKCFFKHLTFLNNGINVSSQGITNATGGAFAMNAGAISDCTFTLNYAKSSTKGDSLAKGGAVYAPALGKDALIERCLFRYNYVEALGGRKAQAGAGALSLPRGIVTDSTFLRNYARATVSPAGANTPVNVVARGGAISTLFPYYMTQGTIKNCWFEANYVAANAPYGDVIAQGGAVYGVYSIQDSDFYYNFTMAASLSQGGAVFASSFQNNGKRDLLTVSAVEKDSVFRYNRMGVTRFNDNDGRPEDGIANAIYSYPETITKNDDGKWYTNTSADSVFSFQARAGRSVIFYDPVVLQLGMIQTSPCKQLLELNRPDADGSINEGRIVFTGEDFAEADHAENWTSRFYYDMDARLYNGTLVIKDKAIVGAPYIVDDTFAKPENGSYNSEIGLKSFTMDKGVLEITGKGQLMAREVLINGGHELSSFRTGTGAVLTAYTVDLSQGVSFDFAPFLDRHDSGLHISAGSVTLGGSMGITDTLDHYTDNRWASRQEYLALSFSTDAADSLSGSDFSNIISHASGSGDNVINSPYTYQGYWTKVWKDSDNDGISDELYAVWTPTEDIKEVQPELDGDSTLNSLWSTVSNMEALGSAALGQIGVNRYKMEQCTNYWAQGLGDFDMHRRVNGRDGYDYNGFGYAVGADMRFCPDNWLLGAAFGNLYGKNKSRNYNSEIKQASYIGMIYGGYYKEYDPINALNVTASASYGVTTNRLHTYYGDGERSNGKWDNTAMRYTLKGEWVRTLNDHWSLNPFIGLEYDDARQDSFTESGDKARRFGKSNLHNLSMPVGVGFWRTDRFENGRVWINGLELSYVPDVYRKNPEAGAERLSNGFTWTTHGVQPSRNAGRTAYSTRVIWNKTWSTFAGYELDFRKNALYQSVNLGFSAAF